MISWWENIPKIVHKGQKKRTFSGGKNAPSVHAVGEDGGTVDLRCDMLSTAIYLPSPRIVTVAYLVAHGDDNVFKLW
jgi:hypothetical protein